MNSSSLHRFFLDAFQGPQLVEIFSPGRANVIGEHTDYNGGFVLPFAIDRGITFLANKSISKKTKIIAFDLDEAVSFEKALIGPSYPWMRYLTNALEVLNAKGFVSKGFNLLFGGNLPIGAGVSSSSALSCGFIKTLDALFDFGLTKEQIVLFASLAENGTGVQGGMMDQHAIVHGEKEACLFIDCENRHIEKVAMPQNEKHQWVLFNTGVEHNLADTEYNKRRKECDEALTIIQEKKGKALTFRQLKDSDLTSLEDSKLKQRITHYISENERVKKMLVAFKKNDINLILHLLNDSHESLSKRYEVSCEELDYVQSALMKENYGGRMMGGGFGGCVISYLAKKDFKVFTQKISVTFKSKFGLTLKAFPIKASEGLRLV